MWNKLLACLVALFFLINAILSISISVTDMERTYRENDANFEKTLTHTTRTGYSLHQPIRINSNQDFDLQFPGRIISGLEIDGSGKGYCIYIGNVSGWYKIENCYLHDATGNDIDYCKNSALYIWGGSDAYISNLTIERAKHGILMSYTSQIRIENCTFNSTEYGIKTQSASDSSFENNDLKTIEYGLYLYASSSVTVFGNKINECANNGVSLVESNICNVFNNNVNECNMGVYVYLGSKHTISQNNISNNKYGIRITSTYENHIRYNNLSANDYGIYLYNSNNNMVSNNTVLLCDYGIRLSENSIDNTVFGNCIAFCNQTGIHLLHSKPNLINNNTLSNNSEKGILVEDSIGIILENNSISWSRYGIHTVSKSNESVIRNNTLSNNFDGMMISTSSFVRIYGNKLFSNERCGVRLYDSEYAYLKENEFMNCSILIYGFGLNKWNTHYIDNTNKVNGKSIVYLCNHSSIVPVSNVGEAILVNCTNINITNQNCINVGIAVLEAYSIGCTYQSNVISGGYYGIYSYRCVDTKMIGNEISNFTHSGIILYNTDQSTIKQNIIRNCTNGIWTDGKVNSILNNNIANCTFGINISDSCSSVKDNVFENNDYGIYLNNPISCTFSANIMNKCGFFFPNTCHYYNTQSIDTTNKVNGKDVLYVKNATGISVTQNAGQVIFAYCTNCNIEGGNYSNTTVGIIITHSSDIKIKNVNASNNKHSGVFVYYNTSTTITSSHFENNKFAGIHSEANTPIFSYNSISNSTYGIFLYACYGGMIANNNISNCTNGIYSEVFVSTGCRIYGNNTAWNCENGIYILNENNNILEYNNVTNCGLGISLNMCYNLIAKNNTVCKCRIGVKLEKSNLCKFLSNNISHSERGLYLSESMQNVILHNSLSSNEYSNLYLYQSSWNLIEDSRINDGDYGIMLFYSNYNNIRSNKIRNNNESVLLSGSLNNNITENEICANLRNCIGIYKESNENNISLNQLSAINQSGGIHLSSSKRNMIIGNEMVNCSISFEGLDHEHWSTHKISDTNRINGRRIIYVSDTDNLEYSDMEIGELIIVDCVNLSFSNVTVFGAQYGMIVAFSSMCNFDGVSAVMINQDGFGNGLVLYHSKFCKLNQSNITCSKFGVVIEHSDNNEIKKCNISLNKIGIWLNASRGNMLEKNKFVENSEYGIVVLNSTGTNEFFSNSFISNGDEYLQAYDDSLLNRWYSNGRGNYWSTWTAPDENNDGIVDIPYDKNCASQYDATNMLCDLYPIANFSYINIPPTASIIDVLPSNVSFLGDYVYVIGLAWDYDGYITNYEWLSNISGIIGYSQILNASVLPVGVHNISFRACDDFGAWSTRAYVELRIMPMPIFVENMRPQCMINGISPNPASKNDTIYFNGSAVDYDGYVIEYVWKSSLDGILVQSSIEPTGDINITFTNMSIGEHVISLLVKDNNGSWSEEKNWTLIVYERGEIGNTKPNATIISISPLEAIEMESITFVGNGTDPDGYITEYRWVSSIDGELSNLPVFSTNNLSVGAHTIYFMVRDDKGEWSNLSSLVVKINPKPANELPVAWIVTNPIIIIDQGTEITLSGDASDVDGTIVSYLWYSSENGNLSNEKIITMKSLSVGEHIFYFAAKDNNGSWSNVCNVTVFVRNVNAPPQILGNFGTIELINEKKIELAGRAYDDKDNESSLTWSVECGSDLISVELDGLNKSIKIKRLGSSGISSFILKLTDSQGLNDTEVISVHVLESPANNTSNSKIIKETDYTMAVILLILGVVFGIAIGYFVNSRKKQDSNVQKMVISYDNSTMNMNTQQSIGNVAENASMQNYKSNKLEVNMNSDEIIQEYSEQAVAYPYAKPLESETIDEITNEEVGESITGLENAQFASDQKSIEQKVVKNKQLDGVVILGAKHPKKELELLQEIDRRISNVEASLDSITDVKKLESVTGFLKLAKTYRKSKNCNKALKFLERAETELNPKNKI